MTSSSTCRYVLNSDSYYLFDKGRDQSVLHTAAETPMWVVLFDWSVINETRGDKTALDDPGV